MKFFNSPSRLYEFYKNFLKKNTSDIQKLYTQGELQLIAEDIMSVTNTSLVTTNKSELIRNIKTIVNGWHSLDEDPLGDAFHGATLNVISNTALYLVLWSFLYCTPTMVDIIDSTDTRNSFPMYATWRNS